MRTSGLAAFRIYIVQLSSNTPWWVAQERARIAPQKAPGSADDTRSYSGGLDLSHDLASELKLVGSASVSGSGTDSWLAMPAVSGSASLQWSPGGGSALSASISDQIGGSYHLSMAVVRPFN